MKGYYVWCFQPVSDKIETPFKARIEADHGNYWQLKVGKSLYKANKAACSTVPFRDDKHAKSDEYRAQVEQTVADKERSVLQAEGSGDPISDTQAVEAPTTHEKTHTKKPANTRFQRSGHGQNQGASGRLRGAPSKWWAGRFSRST